MILFVFDVSQPDEIFQNSSWLVSFRLSIIMEVLMYFTSCTYLIFLTLSYINNSYYLFINDIIFKMFHINWLYFKERYMYFQRFLFHLILDFFIIQSRITIFFIKNRICMFRSKIMNLETMKYIKTINKKNYFLFFRTKFSTSSYLKINFSKKYLVFKNEIKPIIFLRKLYIRKYTLFFINASHLFFY